MLITVGLDSKLKDKHEKLNVGDLLDEGCDQSLL